MKKTVLAVATALTIGVTAPAFAEGNGPLTRGDSANSLPPGFYNGTPQQIQAQIRDNWYASQQAAQHLANQPTQQSTPTSMLPNG